MRVSSLPLIATNLAGVGAAGACLVVGLAMRADAGRAARALITELDTSSPPAIGPQPVGQAARTLSSTAPKSHARFSTRRWGRGRARAARCSARGGVR